MPNHAMKRIKALLGALLPLVGVNVAGAAADWPELPSSGFISGRATSKEDVNKGNAVFVASDNDGKVIGKPLQITIPQYAYWTSGAGKRMAVIVVQAEEANGTQMFGFRYRG